MSRKWLYESHLGGFYLTNEELPYDALYCEQCGDSDTPYGEMNSFQEAWNSLADMIAFSDEDGGYLPEYIFPLLLEVATPEEKEIINLACGNLSVNRYGLCSIPQEKLLEAAKTIGCVTTHDEEKV